MTIQTDIISETFAAQKAAFEKSTYIVAVMKSGGYWDGDKCAYIKTETPIAYVEQSERGYAITDDMSRAIRVKEKPVSYGDNASELGCWMNLSERHDPYFEGKSFGLVSLSDEPHGATCMCNDCIRKGAA